jgi:uncharacterized repeat protein (TIGR01451 family)
MGESVGKPMFSRALRAVASGAAVLLVAAGLTVAGAATTAPPASAAQNPTTCAGGVSLVNGGFEQPAVANASYRLFPQAQVPGWSTTDSQGAIELWSSGFQGVPSAAGRQFAELNAYSASRLYQDVATTPGQTLSWSLKHRGRSGTDVMRVVIGAPGGSLAQSGPNLSDGTTAWGSHSGTYTVPAGQTVTRFGFEAVSSAGGPAAGNFLDDITFGTGPCLISSKTVTNLTRTGTTAEVGDVLRYTVTTRNDGGNPALQSVSTDVLEDGIDYVPGSLRIVSGPAAGAQTDVAGDDRAEYLGATRTVRVRLGESATTAAGGSISVGVATSYSFDARVTAAAADATVDNTASVSFRDAVANQTRTSTAQTVVTPVAPAADLAVTKTLDTDPVVAGEPVSFTITATNNGPQVGTGVTVTDVLPAGLRDVQVEGASCATDAGTLSCDLPDLAVGATHTLTVTGVVPASTDPGAALTNVAAVSGTRTDPNRANNTAVADGTVTTSADVSIAKAFDPAAPVAGGTVTYTLTAHNDGPSDARDVVITDPIDPQTTLVSATLAGAPCAFDGTTVRCDVGTLEPGASAVATLTVTLAAQATAVVQNTAIVTSTTSDPDPSDNAGSAAFQPEVIADMAVVKTASAAVVQAGDPISFTLDVSNNGPSDAADAVLTDALPAGFEITGVQADADATCTVDGQSVRCVWDTFASETSRVVTVAARVAADAPAGTVTNTASVAAPADDRDTTNNSGAVDIAVEQSADLRIAKVAEPATGVPGADQSFRLTIVNDGPSLARGVTVSDPLPADFTATGVDRDDCTVIAGVVQCTIGDLAPGATAEVMVSGTLAAGATGTLSNTASTSSATPDPDGSDNSATAQLPLAPSADVSLTKTASSSTVALGGTVEYVVTVRNDGPSAAAAVIVDEHPDPGIRITGATPSAGTWSPTDARWSVGTLLPGEEATLTVTARADAEGTFANSATASSPTPDPDTNDRTGRAEVVVTPSADLEIEKTASVSPVPVNGEITYTLTVRNHGPSAAQGVVVSDALPAELIDPRTTTAGCEVVDRTLACSTASLAADEVAEYRLTARVDPATGSASVTNVATVTSATPDGVEENDTARVETPITGSPQVELVKAAGAPTEANGDGRIGAGDTVAYTFTVRNTGPTVLTDVTIDDPLLGGAVTCPALDGATLAPDDEIPCEPITYTLTQSDVDRGAVHNEASVAARSPRGDAGDAASADIAVPRANGVSLAKSAGIPVDVDGDGALGAGDTVEYSFTVRNTGTTTLTDAVIVDPLLGGRLDCAALDEAAIAPDEAVDCGPVTYELTQADIDAGVVHNTADVTASAPEGTVTDTAQADVSVTGADAIELIKTVVGVADVDDDGAIGAGDELSYRFSVRNVGTTTLTDAAIDDPLLGGGIDCPELTGAPLAPGDAVECGPVPYTLTQDDIENGAVHNDATVTATGASGVAGGVADAAAADALISGVGRVELTKTAGTPVDATGDGRLGAGDTVDYTFTVRNAGTTILSGIALADPLLGGALACPALDDLRLAPGDEAECGPLAYTLTQADIDAGTVHNEASATARSGDSTVEDTAAVDVAVPGTGALALEKTAGAVVDADEDGRHGAGDTIAYTFAVRNTGTTTVTDVAVADPRLEGEIVCAGTVLAPGELTVCEATAPAALTQAEVDAGEIVNTATVTGVGPDGKPIEARDSLTTPIEAQPAIALEKTGAYADADDDGVVGPGDAVAFRFVVTNTGAVTLTDIVIDDPLLGGELACDLPALAPGERAECGPLTYELTRADLRAGTVTNAATVGAGSASGGAQAASADAVTVDVPTVAGPADVPPVADPADDVPPGADPADTPPGADPAGIPPLAATGGTLALLPWAFGLLAAGAILVLIRVRRATRR